MPSLTRGIEALAKVFPPEGSIPGRKFPRVREVIPASPLFFLIFHQSFVNFELLQNFSSACKVMG